MLYTKKTRGKTVAFQKVPSEQIRRTGDALQNLLLNRTDSMMAQIQQVMLTRDSYSIIAWAGQMRMLASFVRIYANHDADFPKKIDELQNRVDRIFSMPESNQKRKELLDVYEQMFFEIAVRFKRFNLYPPLSVGYRQGVGETREADK